MEIIASVIFFILGLVLVFFEGYVFEDDGNPDMAIFGVILVVASIFAFTLDIHDSAQKETYKEAYKSGQVDALTHKIKYRLATKSDSTKVWEEISKSDTNK